MEDIHPVKSVIEPEWSGVLLVLLLVGMLVLLSYVIVRWRKKGQVRQVEQAEQVVSSETLRRKALREMKELDGLIEGEEWEEYYVRSTEVVKRYVSEVEGEDVVEMTTDEVRKVMGEGDELVRLLEKMDRAKFAELGLERQSVLEVRKAIASYIQSH